MKIDIIEIEGGKKIRFAFEDGTKSDTFASKEVAMEAAIDLFKSNVIGKKEFTKLMSDVMSVEELPFDGSIKKSLIIASTIVAGVTIGGAWKLKDKIFESIDNLLNPQLKEEFQMIEHQIGHGRIHLIGGVSGPIRSKKGAMLIAESYFYEKKLSEEGYERVKKQIIESTLSE